MAGLPVLDVAIGLVFVYLLLALICTTLNEIVATVAKRRPSFLDKGLTQMLGTELKRELYQHPLVSSLSSDPKKVCPSYIPAETFSLALRDVLTGEGKSPNDLKALESNLKEKGSKQFREAITALKLNVTDNRENVDAGKFDTEIQRWFENRMERVSGWYKRRAQLWSLGLAVALTLAFNADTIRIAQKLWTDPVLRASVVQAAAERSRMEPPAEALPMVVYTDPDNPDQGKPVEIKNPLTQTEQAVMSKLVGWDSNSLPTHRSRYWWFMWLLGLSVTSLAVSMGAPFWFDTLNKFMNARNAGRPPEEKARKEAKDGEK
jgi:hypothetical protein